MAAMKGATLQKVNNEIVKAIEHLQLQESTLQDEVSKIESQRRSLEDQISELKLELDKVVEKQIEKNSKLNQTRETIKETQDAYAQIVESSQVLLSVVKKDSQELQRNGRHQSKSDVNNEINKCTNRK